MSFGEATGGRRWKRRTRNRRSRKMKKKLNISTKYMKCNAKDTKRFSPQRSDTVVMSIRGSRIDVMVEYRCKRNPKSMLFENEYYNFHACTHNREYETMTSSFGLFLSLCPQSYSLLLVARRPDKFFFCVKYFMYVHPTIL